MHKNVSPNTCCFHRIAVFANEKALFLRLGSSVHHFEHVIKQETHIFTKMIIYNSFIKPFRFYHYYQIFLKIHEILSKVKLFTKSGHTALPLNSHKATGDEATPMLPRFFSGFRPSPKTILYLPYGCARVKLESLFSHTTEGKIYSGNCIL